MQNLDGKLITAIEQQADRYKYFRDLGIHQAGLRELEEGHISYITRIVKAEGYDEKDYLKLYRSLIK